MRNFIISLMTIALAACAGMTPTVTRQEAYAIYDIKGVSSPAVGVSDAITHALQKNMTGVRISKEIPPSPLPTSPQRFFLNEMFKGNGFAAAAGVSFKVPNCPGSMLTTMASNEAMAKYGENTTFFVCLQPYAGGYWMTVYSTFSKRTGATTPAAIGVDLARAFVGDSSQFILRTVNDLIAAVKGTGGTVTLLKAYP